MLTFLLATSLALPVFAQPQTATGSVNDVALQQSLTGTWAGVLEYRDYSEPATSTKRVDLPTWLTVNVSGKSMIWKYTYDDGPNKVLEEIDSVTFDSATHSYTESSDGKAALIYSVDGYESLKEGRGVLVMHGSGSDNDKPAETRVTMTIRRNLMEVTEEVRPARSSEPFAFRHMYRFTRAEPPATRRGK